jgi:hypothetical protein
MLQSAIEMEVDDLMAKRNDLRDAQDSRMVVPAFPE